MDHTTGLQSLQFNLGLLQGVVLGHGAFAHGAGIADAQHNERLAALARLKGQVGLEAAAGVVAIGVAIEHDH